jgi:hypothetical protein
LLIPTGEAVAWTGTASKETGSRSKASGAGQAIDDDFDVIDGKQISLKADCSNATATPRTRRSSGILVRPPEMVIADVRKAPVRRGFFWLVGLKF